MALIVLFVAAVVMMASVISTPVSCGIGCGYGSAGGGASRGNRESMAAAAQLGAKQYGNATYKSLKWLLFYLHLSSGVIIYYCNHQSVWY